MRRTSRGRPPPTSPKPTQELEMRKAVTGETHRLEWQAPGPLTAAPTATWREEGQASIIYLTQTRADISVSAIAADRRTLTVASQASGLQADQARAFLITAGDSIYPVVLTRFVGTTAILAEPLPSRDRPRHQRHAHLRAVVWHSPLMGHCDLCDLCDGGDLLDRPRAGGRDARGARPVQGDASTLQHRSRP
jgi:hypothetical protein